MASVADPTVYMKKKNIFSSLLQDHFDVVKSKCYAATVLLGRLIMHYNSGPT